MGRPVARSDGRAEPRARRRSAADARTVIVTVRRAAVVAYARVPSDALRDAPFARARVRKTSATRPRQRPPTARHVLRTTSLPARALDHAALSRAAAAAVVATFRASTVSEARAVPSGRTSPASKRSAAPA